MAGRPNFKCVTFYDRKFVGVQMRPSSIELRNPVAAGFTVLETSKLHMYKFHYNYALPILGGAHECQLLMTDTDSLVYLVKGEDVKNRLASAAPRYFDLSNFPTDHPLHSRVNQKIKGTFKIEHADKTIVEFIGIRAKMYSFRFLECKHLVKKAKGINRTAMNKLSFQNYKQALTQSRPEDQHYCRFKTITSKRHQLYTEEKRKKGLSCLDLKRWICDDGVRTWAYGDIRCGQSALPASSAPMNSSSEDEEDEI